MRKYKNKIIIGAVILAVLAVVFWWGGNAPGLRGWNVSVPPPTNDSVETVPPSETIAPEITAKPTEIPTEEPTATPQEKQTEKPSAIPEKRPGGAEGKLTADEKVALAAKMASGSSKGVEKGNAEYSGKQGMEIDNATGKDKYLTDPVPAGKPIPVEPQNVVITDKEMTCILSIKCDTILKNMGWLDPEKIELVPKDGVIFAERTVTFYEGESVFNVLLREMKKNKIHMEFKNTPIYNSAYIEGIHNLYEFDCGELSGWMYKVNGWFPNYGCSRYQLKQDDKIEWVYTCDLGVDVGGYYAATGE